MIKTIKGYENYFISTSGKVYNKLGQEVRQRKSSAGYMRFNVRKGNVKYEKPYTITTHRAVAEAFIPKVDGKTFINHKDGNKLNNDVSNLEWCTASENTKHSFDNGLQVNKKGKESPFAKTILQFDKQGNFIKEWECIKEAGDTLGIDGGDISRCAKGKRKSAGGFVWKYKGGGFPL